MTFEVVDVCYPILSVAGLVADGHRVTFRGQEAELGTAGRSRRTADAHSGLWYLLVWVDNNREFVLVDSGAACHVCPLGWAHRRRCGNKQLTPTIERRSEKLAPIAEEVCDLAPQPERHAPLVEPMREPSCPTPGEVARHELTHLPVAAWCEACVKGRGREAPHQDQRVCMLDSV